MKERAMLLVSPRLQERGRAKTSAPRNPKRTLILDMLAYVQPIWQKSFTTYLEPPEREVLLVSPRPRERGRAKTSAPRPEREL